MRDLGLQVETFSVCKPTAKDAIDDAARREAATTRWLKPPPVLTLVLAMGWACLTRPVSVLRALGIVLFQKNAGLQPRILWFCYLCEGMLLAYWLVREEIKHLHCHFGNTGASAGMLAAHIANVPFSMTCHGTELQEAEHHRLAEKVKRATFVVCVSRYGKAHLMYTCPPEDWHKVQVVHCGLPAAHESPIARRNEVPEILCVARLSHEKAHLVLLDAAALLRDRGVEFKLTLVGDGPLREAIEKRIVELELQSIVALRGSLPPATVDLHYHCCDLVVLSSLMEGIPVVLMEAMSKGLPVVATRVGGIPELITHGVNGLLVSPGEAGELADALHCLLLDRELASRLGKAALQAVQREFMLGPNVDKLIALFTQSASCSPHVMQSKEIKTLNRHVQPENS